MKSVVVIAVLVVACGDGGAGIQEQPTIAEITVNAPTTRIDVGQTLQLTARAKDASGTEVEDAAFEWTSGITDVATVSQDGIVTGRGKGGSRIRATVGDVTGSVIIHVDLGPRAE